MSKINLNVTLIDPEDEQYKPLLDNLQGNIIKGHGRMYTTSLFIQFVGAPAAVKQWIGDFSRKYVTSTSVQIQQAKRHERAPKEAGELFGNFFLTAVGYQRFQLGLVPRDPQARFNAGMKNREDRNPLGDPPVEQWEQGYQSEIHALAFLAHGDDAALKKGCDEVLASLSGVGALLVREEGQRWLNADGEDIEPFGYRDGVSQPVFLKGDDKLPDSDSIWDASAPLKLVLVEDPNVTDTDCYGSFLVFRKLEQHVEKFNDQVSKLAQKLEVSEELAGAYVVGRFKDGTPVVASDKPGLERDKRVNFDYEKDATASRCPFHSHVRKTNPRGDTGRLAQPAIPLEEEREHRIARRGQPYGKPGDTTGAKVGLLFLCFQGDIAYQFEFVQSSWANSLHFVKGNAGMDGLIGQGTQVPGGQKWPAKYGDKESGRVAFDFSHVITLRGGDYFFAPSVRFLTSLGNSRSSTEVEGHLDRGT